MQSIPLLISTKAAAESRKFYIERGYITKYLREIPPSREVSVVYVLAPSSNVARGLG